MNNTRFYKVFKSLLDKMSSDGYSREANYLDSKFLKLSRIDPEANFDIDPGSIFNSKIPSEVIDELLALAQSYYLSLEHLQNLTSGLRAYSFSIIDAIAIESYASDRYQEDRIKAVRQKQKIEDINVEDLIEEALEQIPSGHHLWYDKSLEYIKRILSVGDGSEELALFLKVLASTSNNANPRSNFTLAIKALRQHIAGENLAGFYPVVIDNLNRTFSGEELSGPKIKAFYKNLLGDQDAVTVDKHMWQIIYGKDRGTPNRQKYAVMIIAKVARDVGLTNAQAQAALWAANHFRNDRVPGDYLSEIEKRQSELIEIFSDLEKIRGL
tara:strand:- start:3209 stop:4186 length:978 start_codon:yes stop_codon:yes gene_type:complete